MIFNLSLRPGKDDQLIEHLDSLPKSGRSRWIREQLYVALNGQPILEQILAKVQLLAVGGVAVVSLPETEKDPFFSSFGK